MVIHDFHVVGVTLPPDKTDPPLVVNADAVLALPVTPQALQAVAGRGGKVAELGGAIQLSQLALGDPLDPLIPPHPAAGMEMLGVWGAKGFDHPDSLPREGLYVKR